MRVLPLVAAVVLFGCTVAHAQTVMTPSGLGPTSPLGIPGSSAANGSNSGTGISLGATEIDPGGLSPAPVSNCDTNGLSGTSSAIAGSSGSGMSSMPVTSSVFDGGGFASTMASACSSIAGATSTAAVPPLSAMGANSTFTLNGGTIPLGSTEINSAGISPLITVPMSNGSTSFCAGSTAVGSSVAMSSTSAGTSVNQSGC
jgi:hypothetical protein